MSIDHGRSPSEPGYSAEPEPKEVSAVPVSIPNAVVAIQEFIEQHSDAQVRIDDSHTSDWQSLTFRGQRASAQMWADDTASALRPVLAALIDAEFNLPGQIIADVEVTHPPQDVPTWGGCSFGIEVLSIDDDSASAIEAASAGETTKIGSAEGESAVGEAETPEPLGSTNPNTERQSL